MRVLNYPEFAEIRAELLRDYAPANAQERLLVNELAESWRRLREARDREELFFDLQRFKQATDDGMDVETIRSQKGAEVIMWLEKPHLAYDQVLRSIRDAEHAWNNAIKRIEEVQDRRFRRERLLRKEQQRLLRKEQQRFAAPTKPTIETRTAAASVDAPAVGTSHGPIAQHHSSIARESVAVPLQPDAAPPQHPLRN